MRTKSCQYETIETELYVILPVIKVHHRSSSLDDIIHDLWWNTIRFSMEFVFTIYSSCLVLTLNVFLSLTAAKITLAYCSDNGFMHHTYV